MRESSIERKVGQYAKYKGWLHYKFKSTGAKGVPDRIFFKNGRTFLIEFKATGQKPDPLQVLIINKLRLQNIAVYVIDDVDEGKRTIDMNERPAP